MRNTFAGAVRTRYFYRGVREGDLNVAFLRPWVGKVAPVRGAPGPDTPHLGQGEKRGEGERRHSSEKESESKQTVRINLLVLASTDAASNRWRPSPEWSGPAQHEPWPTPDLHGGDVRARVKMSAEVSLAPSTIPCDATLHLPSVSFPQAHVIITVNNWQRSAEWYRQLLGHLGLSCVADTDRGNRLSPVVDCIPCIFQVLSLSPRPPLLPLVRGCVLYRAR